MVYTILVVIYSSERKKVFREISITYTGISNIKHIKKSVVSRYIYIYIKCLKGE